MRRDAPAAATRVGNFVGALPHFMWQVLATREVAVFGEPYSLHSLSAYLLYTMGVTGAVPVVTSIYLVMPVGRISRRHALLRGVVACVLWEFTRHALVWNYATLSQIHPVRLVRRGDRGAVERRGGGDLPSPWCSGDRDVRGAPSAE